MTNVYYTLHVQESQHTVNALVSDWPDLTIGGRARVQFSLQDNGSLTVASGETHTVSADTAEFYETVTVEDSGTLTVEDDARLVVGSQASRFNALADYGEVAGHAAQLDTTTHVPHFVEQLAADAPVTSIVVGVEPGPKPTDRGREGFWGLLLGVSDETNAATTNHVIGLDLWVLAVPFSTYGSVAGLKTDLEA